MAFSIHCFECAGEKKLWWKYRNGGKIDKKIPDLKKDNSKKKSSKFV